MQAYHNDPALKIQCLELMADHRAADRLAQGHGYWRDEKGCAVGCLLHSLGGEPDNYIDYERLIGVPEILAVLEDSIFENLSAEDAQEWPERFLDAIPVGADLSRVSWQFLDWVLSDLPPTDHEDVSLAIEQVRTTVLQPLSRGETVDKKIINAACAVAADAAAVCAVRAVACAARAAFCAVTYAVYAIDAARATARAADAADYAARIASVYAVADYAACVAAAAYDAAADAARTVRKRQANKLIELLKAA